MQYKYQVTYCCGLIVPVTSIPRKQLDQSIPISSICRGMRPEIVKFMTPTQRGGSWGGGLKINVFLKKKIFVSSQGHGPYKLNV